MNWIYAIIATVISYTLFSYFGLRTGTASTFRDAALSPFTNIIDLTLVLTGSAGFGVATYFALKSSSYAVPIIISLGLIVSFIFATIFSDGKITVERLIGLLVIVLGIVLIK